MLFVCGIGMRYLFNRPIGWVDEAVTVLSVWSVLWTAPSCCAGTSTFDILYVSIARRASA